MIKKLCMGVSLKLSEKFSHVVTSTMEDYVKLIHDPRIKQIVDAVRNGDESKKKLLPIRCAHYWHFNDDRRTQANADPKAFTYQTTVDIDHLPDGLTNDKVLQGVLALNKKEGMWKDKVLHGEYSVHKKLHFDIRLLTGKGIAESQEQFIADLNQELGLSIPKVMGKGKDIDNYVLTPDASCYTPERCIFITGDDIFTNEGWYAVKDHEDNLAVEPVKIDHHSDSSKAAAVSEQFPDTYEGIPYSRIREELEDQLGGIPEHGSRNTFIYSIACHLRPICDSNPEWVRRVLPGDFYGESADRAIATIKSACNSAKIPNISRKLQAALKICHMMQDKSNDNAAEPPVLPGRLPRAVKLLVSKVPDLYKPCVANAIFPPLATHLNGVRFRYNDNTEIEPSMMCLIMASMTAGKSCVNKPIEYIMKDIDEKDEQQRKLLQDYNDSVNMKGANERGDKRGYFPIQHILTNITHAAFITRLNDAGGKPLYSNMNELDMLDDLCSSSRIRVSGIIRLAYDCDIYGQERAGTQSVTATPRLRWNWNASTTIQKGQRYFHNGLVDGTLSRINLCTIIAPVNGGMPKYGIYNKKFADSLKPYIDNLNAYCGKGVIVCRKANKLVDEMLAENSEIYVLTGDKSRLQLSYRSVVMAFKKVMILYIMNGCRWEKAFEDFFRWSVRYDLWNKNRFFGNQLRDAISAETRNLSRGPVNLLERLNDRFTRNDAELLRRSNGMEPNPRHMLATWKNRGFIDFDEATDEYFKTKKYLDRKAA